MKKVFSTVGAYLRGADLLLLGLCCVCTVFGIVAINSATEYLGDSANMVTVQIAALVLGIMAYIFFSVIELDIIAEQSRLLYLFCLLFVSMLFVWGVEDNTGNRAWMVVPYIGISIQPSEVCKVLYVIVLARTATIRRDKINAPGTILMLVMQLLVLVGLYVVASQDVGSAVVFFAIFIFIAFASGVSFGWFLGGFAALCAVLPIAANIMPEYMINRILVVYDPTIDPTAIGTRWQMERTQAALGGGGLFGQGYGNGTLTSYGGLGSAQHTDCIFASIGEEMGLVGCLAVLLLLAAVVIRCLYVGMKSGSYTNRLVCVGIAGMFMFQIIINVGMNMGVLPVIGLTLPFFSYGGSSVVMSFAAMGIVSGIHKTPDSDSMIRYVRPPVSVRR